MEAASKGSRFEGEDWWQGVREREHRLLKRLGLELAFDLMPGEFGEQDPQATPVDYWWSPKPALSRSLAAGWWMGCEGYIVPRADRERLRQCLVSHPSRVAVTAVNHCHLIFSALGEGEQMLILSKRVTLRQLARTIKSIPVRRALRKLTNVARLTEWKVVQHGLEGRWERKQ